MGDAKWIRQRRERMYRIVKRIAKKQEGPFTVKDIRPAVSKALFSHERWLLTSNRITGAINRLVREGNLQITGREERAEGRFPVNVYSWMDSPQKNQGTESQS